MKIPTVENCDWQLVNHQKWEGFAFGKSLWKLHWKAADSLPVLGYASLISWKYIKTDLFSSPLSVPRVKNKTKQTNTLKTEVCTTSEIYLLSVWMIPNGLILSFLFNVNFLPPKEKATPRKLEPECWRLLPVPRKMTWETRFPSRIICSHPRNTDFFFSIYVDSDFSWSEKGLRSDISTYLPRE